MRFSQIPHLVSLGINAVELLPVFEYDELEFQRFKNPRDHMVNIWGYSHLNFFAPMSRFAANREGPIGAARQFKDMVSALVVFGMPLSGLTLSLCAIQIPQSWHRSHSRCRLQSHSRIG